LRTVPSSATNVGETWHFTVRPRDGTDFGDTQTSAQVTIIENTPPEASDLLISPSAPYTTNNLVGSYSYYDADGDAESGTEIRWYKNGVLQSAYNGKLVVPSTATAEGQTWYFTVKPKDGEDFGTLRKSPSVTIGKVNNAPAASKLTISPSTPYTTDDLVGSYDYYDADGDPESGTQIKWYKDGVLQVDFNDRLTIPSNATSEDETWYFTVRPKDGKDFGTLQTSPSVTILAVKRDVAVIEVVPWKTVVGQGLPIYINVTVENQAGAAATFNVTAYANESTIQTTAVTLSNYSSTIIIFAWNTTGLTVGNYTISAGATVLPGETDVSDNTYVYGLVAVSIPGDLNCDGTVNIVDLFIVAKAFGCKPSDENWDANADINCDGVINIEDLFTLAKEYGKSL